MAFALHNIIKLTRTHIFLNSKFDLQIQKKINILYTFFKKKNTKKEKNISYVHPIERVDEVGEMKTSNDYWGLVEWGRGVRSWSFLQSV